MGEGVNKPAPLHYTERVVIRRNGTVTYTGGGGYPVCVSGGRAYAIKAAGNTTDNRLLVTCKRCRLAIKHEIEGNLRP